MKTIAINGLGRIGKLAVRALHDAGLLDRIVLINEPVSSTEQLAHLLEFDTVHGRWSADIGFEEHCLTIDNHRIAVTRSAAIDALPLSNVDLVIDCSGAHRTIDAMQPYFESGIQKVLVSGPVKDTEALNIVYGINHHEYTPDRHHVVTAASCTTNCIAPVIKALHDAIGIMHGTITTLHDVTNSQTIVDKPAKDLRRARSCLNSLIPTTTGSATAISLIFPELAGLLNGQAIRVPLLNASLTDCVFEMKRPTTAGEINRVLESAANTSLAGILGFETRPLVSADFVNDSRSAIIDADCTQVVDHSLVKVFAWYDNEWGYTCRLTDIAKMMLNKSR